MCGLIVAPGRYTTSKVEAAMSRMAYRGDGEPGHESIVTTNGWRLGHTRLAIQNRTPLGDQPFGTMDSVVAFVGEFFNHGGLGEKQYLREILDDPVTNFHKADGFWSVAQIQKNVVRVFTDHLGIKPIYYWPKHQIVCSEIEPMFAFEQQPILDQTYLSNCIKFGYDYSGRTPYEGIHQLAPGSVLEMDRFGMFQIRAYWDWVKVPQPHTSLREVVQHAIEKRMIGGRPVALLLSGGLDSSIVYYTLKERNWNIEAFSVENGETEYLPPDVTILDLPAVSPLEAVEVMKAPLDLGSLVPQVQLARAVADQGFNVCMSGDGADEVFGGYRRAKEYDSQWSDIFCELPYYHLPRLDRVMMASTIELRSPFLAPAVIAAGLRLPHKLRTEKQALKAAFKGVVPDEIINRAKHPLKTEAVKTGGVEYRRRLVQNFREFINSKEA